MYFALIRLCTIRACVIRDVGDLQDCSADLEAQPYEGIQGSPQHASLFVTHGFLSSETGCEPIILSPIKYTHTQSARLNADGPVEYKLLYNDA
ncbi:Uncharacterized protein HZ326_15552 [Fusarium oxysporum f. sp. albedinis]|nr:Uncharacterized protein HZ326_15552 [Fusarium oxysporum f. sp. albedinis]